MKLRRSGFTLLELLAVMSVLAVLMSIIAFTVLTLGRMDQADAVVFNHMMNHDALADQFRGDVAQALSAPEQWGRFQAGKHCLILALDKNVFVVYELDRQGLTRWHHQADKKTSQRMQFGTGTVEFLRDDPRLLKMRVTAGDGPHQRIPLEIAAALGGERR